jgi:hypothetical protein
MAEALTNTTGTYMPDQFMKTMREKIVNDDQYTNDQLANTAYLLSTAGLVAGATLGAAAADELTTCVVASLFAASTFPELVNTGIVNVAKAHEFVTTLPEPSEEALAIMAGLDSIN